MVCIKSGLKWSIFWKKICAILHGEKTMINKYPSYFNGLYADRYTDFIANYKMLSKFKKADKNKSTLYEIKVKVLPLRKDLEQNNIKKQFGL